MRFGIRVLAVWSMISLLSVVSLAAPSSDRRLVDALKEGDKETVRFLLKEQIDVNEPEADGSTALAWAAYRDDLEAVELLIRAGANVNAANDYGVTALFLACNNRSPRAGQAAARRRGRSECHPAVGRNTAHGVRAHRQRGRGKIAARPRRGPERK